MIAGDQTKKADGGKRRWNLLPWKALGTIVEVLEYGARRYSEGGWRTVDNAVPRYKEAALRHMISYASGEYWDLCASHTSREERPFDCPKCSGAPHLANLGCCILFLLELDAR